MSSANENRLQQPPDYVAHVHRLLTCDLYLVWHEMENRYFRQGLEMLNARRMSYVFECSLHAIRTCLSLILAKTTYARYGDELSDSTYALRAEKKTGRW